MHWFELYGKLGDAALTRWARKQPALLPAWSGCERADWLLLALLALHDQREVELDRKVLETLVHACAARAFGDAPESDPVEALRVWKAQQARPEEPALRPLQYSPVRNYQPIQVVQQVVERRASTRAAQGRVWAELADLVRAHRWPLKKVPFVRHSRPAFWVAWDLAIASGLATELPTVGMLHAHELRLGLKPLIAGITVREGEILRGLSEQIAARPDWESVYASVRELISAP